MARALKPGQPFCDLWARVQAHVASWQPGDLLITWQAAHLSMQQALAGGFLLENWYGNKQVDDKAKEAAERVMLQGDIPDAARAQAITLRSCAIWVGKSLSAFFAALPPKPEGTRVSRNLSRRLGYKQPQPINVKGHYFMAPTSTSA